MVGVVRGGTMGKKKGCNLLMPAVLVLGASIPQTAVDAGRVGRCDLLRSENQVVTSTQCPSCPLL